MNVIYKCCVYECFIETIEGCKCNPEQKIGKNFTSGFLMPIISFKSMEIKHDVYRGKDFMKKLCES